jgi:hypothetical protein
LFCCVRRYIKNPTFSLNFLPLPEIISQFPCRPDRHSEPSRLYKRYSCNISLTSTLDEGGWSTPRPGRFTTLDIPGIHYMGGRMGPRAGLDKCAKHRLHQDWISGPSSPQHVTVPTELRRPTASGGSGNIFVALFKCTEDEEQTSVTKEMPINCSKASALQKPGVLHVFCSLLYCPTFVCSYVVPDLGNIQRLFWSVSIYYPAKHNT